MPPKVSIIVLNWNQPELTVDCVNSVLKQGYKDFEILLVDNASEDDSAEILRKEFDHNRKIRIVENSENLGYAGGNNEGVRHSKGEYVVILNNDTTVEKNWLKSLVEDLESDKHIGSVSSVEIREGKQLHKNLDAYMYTNSLLTYSVRYRYREELKNTDLVGLFSTRGVSFIYRKELANPPFDPEYFIYAEDMYLGWLLRLKGYKNRLSTRSIVHHFHNLAKKKGGGINKYFTYLGERNRVMNLLIFYEFRNLLRILPLIMAGILSLNISEPQKAPYRLKGYLWIVTHPHRIIMKRRRVQKQRQVPDDGIISKMSYKFYDEGRITNIFIRVINCLFYLYCKALGIRTIEFSD